MRSKVNFVVYGSNLEELERRALQVIAELLQIQSIEGVRARADFEMEISTETNVDKKDYSQIESFVAQVWAKIK
jgi:hypothetical protein